MRSLVGPGGRLDLALASSRGISFSAKVRLCVAEQRRERRATETRISPERTKLIDQAVQFVVVVPSTEMLQADCAGQLSPAAVTAVSERWN